MHKIKNFAKLTISKLYDFNLHRQQNRWAKNILKIIESYKGETDPALIKAADDYAMDVFGWKGFAPDLYLYAAMQGKFIEGWIPYNYYYRVVVPSLQGAYGRVSNLKPFSRLIFKNDLFPDMFYYVNQQWLSRDYEPITEKTIQDIVMHGSEKIVYKIDDSVQGKGVYVIDKSSFDIKLIKKLGSGVMQFYIHQHPFFDEITSHSVATLRLTTVVNSRGLTSLRAGHLKVSQNQDTHITSANQLKIPVNVNTGELSPFGYHNWEQIAKYPATGFSFHGKVLPEFEKCIETVLSLHSKVPFVRIIG